MKKITLSILFAICGLVASSQTLTLKSTMPKGDAVRLSIAATGGSVSIDTGDGIAKDYEVSADVSSPTFLPLTATASNPTIIIKGDVLGIECSSIKLTELDCSEAKSLLVLKCDINNLTELDVSKNARLARLYCNDNMLTSLNLGTGAELLLIYCQENQLTSLNLSNCTKLIELGCYRNAFTEIDLTHCPKLAVVNCSRN